MRKRLLRQLFFVGILSSSMTVSASNMNETADQSVMQEKVMTAETEQAEDLKATESTEYIIENYSYTYAVENKPYSYTYKLTSRGNACIYSCEGEMKGELYIPSVIDGHAVKMIANEAFMECSELTGNLIIPDTVTYIGSSAFAGCTGFNGTLILSNSLTYIGDEAFADCSGFRGNLVIPDSVTIMGAAAFEKTGFDGTLTIGSGIDTIEMNTFDSCTNLKGDLIIPDQVKTIGTRAFFDCCSLDGKLQLSDNITSINRRTFWYCEKLNGALVLPENITYIGEEAFRGCSGFTGELILPKSLKMVCEEAFYECSGFSGKLIIPEGVHNVAERAFGMNEGINEVIVPTTITMDLWAVFQGCSSLTKVTNNSSCTVDLPYYSLSNRRWVAIQNANEVTEDNLDSYAINKIGNGTAVLVDLTDKTGMNFTDIERDSWYYSAVKYVYDNGIMNGTSYTTFVPDGTCTREMMVQILYNIQGKPVYQISNPFTDNTINQWYYNAVLWAYENGITKGINATCFGTGQNVTREQMTGFLYNYAEFRGFDTLARTDISNFTDAEQVSSWAVESMEWAYAKGIISGKGAGVLDPKGTATRAEVAQMIMNFQKIYGK